MCDFSPMLKGSPWFNHTIYRNMSEIIETKQVKHTACQKAWLQTVVLRNSWKASIASFKQLSKVCYAADSIQGWVFLQVEIRVKIQIHVIHGIQIYYHLMPSFSMMLIAYGNSVPEWALLGLYLHDLLLKFNTCAIYGRKRLCCWQLAWKHKSLVLSPATRYPGPELLRDSAN